MSFYSNQDPTRTPNGAVDLLSPPSNRNGGDPPASSSNDTSASFSSERSSIVFVENGTEDDEAPPRNPSSQDSNDNSEIYARLDSFVDSFEEKLDSELQDLESLGVQPSVASKNSVMTMSPAPKSSRKEDPDGSGARAPSAISAAAAAAAAPPNPSNGTTTNASSEQAFKKGKGKSGKNLAMLSGKTDKIMASYQAYLAEIQTENMASLHSFSSSDDDDSELDPALKSIHRVRENVRYSYAYNEEQQNTVTNTVADSCYDNEGGGATQLGAPMAVGDIESAHCGIAPLQRAWNYEDKTPGPMSDITSVGPATIAAGMSPSSRGTNNKSGRIGGMLPGRKRLRRAYAQPWLHSRRAKGGIAMIALSIFIIVVVSITLGVARNDKLKNATDNGNDNGNNKNGVIEPDWEAEYKAEVKKEEAFLAEIHMEHEMEKRVPVSPSKPSPVPELKLTEAAIAIVEETTKASIPVEVEGKKEQEMMTQKEEDVPSAKTENDEAAKKEVQEQQEEVNAHDDPPTEMVYLHYDDKSFDKNDLKHQQDPQDPGQAESDTEVQNANLVGPSESFEVQQADGFGPSDSTATKEQGQDHATSQDNYYTAVMQYEPKMFDRSHGWNGQTYKEALIFCQVAAHGMAVCPYDALCPEGAGAEPLGGYRDGPHGDWAWMPVIDGWNEWVQAGAREKCVRYSHKFGEEPEWGMTGKGIAIEGITQNLMCCANVAR